MVNNRKSALETPRRRRLRRKVFLIKMILAVCLLGILVGGIIFFLRLSYFNVREIEVTGTSQSLSTEIKNMSTEISSGNTMFIIPRKQFFVYPKQEIKDKISISYPHIKDLSIERKNIRDILITIRERVPTATYCNFEMGCVVLDELGYAYKTSLEGEFDMLPVLYTDDKTMIKTSYNPLETKVFKDLLIFIKKLSEFNFHVKEILIEQNETVRIVLDEGEIYIALGESLDSQFTSLKTVLQEIKIFKSIDLRYGKKVFYKTE